MFSCVFSWGLCPAARTFGTSPHREVPRTATACHYGQWTSWSGRGDRGCPHGAPSGSLQPLAEGLAQGPVGLLLRHWAVSGPAYDLPVTPSHLHGGVIGRPWNPLSGILGGLLVEGKSGRGRLSGKCG